MRKIRIKNEKKSFVLPTWSLPLQKWAVAAMLIMVVGISYLFLNNSISSKTNDSITYHTVALEDLSNEEIETYVDANEWMTEIDTQTQLQKENNNLNFLDKEQIEEIKKTNRWQPPFLDLTIALENSRLQQTYNTPALATIHMFENQVSWFNENGGLKWSSNKSKTSSDFLYDWAESRDFAKPFVEKKHLRSSVVATIDFVDSIDALQISAILRANGIVDTDSYRKIGKNQIRIGVFPSVELSDVEALTNCIDFIVEKL